MTYQKNLFDQFGRHHARQATLFADADGPELTGLSCAECGSPMERTPSGFILCVNGHGKLREYPEKGEDE